MDIECLHGCTVTVCECANGHEFEFLQVVHLFWLFVVSFIETLLLVVLDGALCTRTHASNTHVWNIPLIVPVMLFFSTFFHFIYLVLCCYYYGGCCSCCLSTVLDLFRFFMSRLTICTPFSTIQ